MADRFKYSEARQKIIAAIRTDLIGPKEEEEVLTESPRSAYLTGMLDTQSGNKDYSAGEQEIDTDIAFKEGEDFTSDEEDDDMEWVERNTDGSGHRWREAVDEAEEEME